MKSNRRTSSLLRLLVQSNWMFQSEHIVAILEKKEGGAQYDGIK